MDDQDRDQDAAETAGPAQRMRSRRSFMMKCVALTGSALIYLTPAVKSYASTQSLSMTGPAFDFSLPANFNVLGDVFTLSVKVPGQAPVPVDFNANVSLRLTAAGSGMAQATALSGTIQSVSASPLASVGVTCGRITLSIVPNSVWGTLNMQTGAFSPGSPVPITVSSTFCASHSESFTNVQVALAKQQEGDTYEGCLNGNKVEVLSVSGPHAGTQVQGTATVLVRPSGS